MITIYIQIKGKNDKILLRHIVLHELIDKYFIIFVFLKSDSIEFMLLNTIENFSRSFIVPKKLILLKPFNPLIYLKEDNL